MERILNVSVYNRNDSMEIEKESFINAGSMKNLIVVGMWFASMGLFAQSAPKADVPQKEKVCVKKCDQIKKAPVRQVDVRKTSVKVGDGRAVQRHSIDHKAKHKGHVRKIDASKKCEKMCEKQKS